MFSLNQEKTDTQENLAEQQHALETSIAKWFVNDYEGVEEIEFTGWGHSPETGSWGTTVIINKDNEISLSFSGLSGLEELTGITYYYYEFHLEERPGVEDLPSARYRSESIEKISLTNIKITYSKDYKENYDGNIR
ncbi:hypothetical protein [Streptococcus sp. CSL10205-OR2]|uniref:hypothetical protein n=1 Tax=Streptococcus sp. CSL10205-OR2 TaxID=2980558 RepID=UPI0021D8B89A|nr:hypothetical protein [Streptococcus sp. CSL10205-OR2]MCU9533535.1 hypothetical protein [Streptococcus sp. CSL10205-OR2]